MKLNIIKIIFFCCILATSSCRKFLEEKPKSFLAPENYFQSEEDALAALVGAYEALGDNSNTYMARPLPYLVWFSSDEALTPRLANERQLDNYSFTSDHSTVATLWRQIYDAINRANVVIEKVPPISMNESRKAQIVAEARFLRALHYFNAVRLWGPVPLMTKVVTSVEEAYVERSPLEDAYAFIIADLEYAAQHLPENNQNGRAEKGAAKALAAKVYLTRATSDAAQSSDYQRAADLSNEVIQSPAYQVVPNFQDAIGGEDEFNKESIFEWQADRNLISVGEHSIFGQFTLPLDIVGLVPEQNQTGESQVVSEIEFFNKFNNNDYRKESTFITSGKRRNGQVVTWQQFTYPYPAPAWKFVNQEATTRSGYAFSTNFPILRLADVYLMRAEALNEINGPNADAYAAINAIRSRARARDGNSTSAFPANLAGLSKDQFRDSVLHERAIELAFEGHRWFDLVRTNRLVQTMKAIHPEYPVSAKHNLFPIPANEIRLNPKLTQNLDW
jgi:hypothetical protein